MKNIGLIDYLNEYYEQEKQKGTFKRNFLSEKMKLWALNLMIEESNHNLREAEGYLTSFLNYNGRFGRLSYYHLNREIARGLKERDCLWYYEQCDDGDDILVFAI